MGRNLKISINDQIVKKTASKEAVFLFLVLNPAAVNWSLNSIFCIFCRFHKGRVHFGLF